MREANVVDIDPRPPGSDALVVEAWAQGYMVGSLIIMSFITVANMRRGVILHKVSADAIARPTLNANHHS